jgi:hypothetical protein
VSALVSIAFTLALVLLTSAAAAALLHSLTAVPFMVMRVGIIAIALAVSTFWTYVGTVWVSEDFIDLRKIDRQRTSEALGT